MIVEECRGLDIHFLKKQGYLRTKGSIVSGTIRWTMGDVETGNVDIKVVLGMADPWKGSKDYLEFYYDIRDLK